MSLVTAMKISTLIENLPVRRVNGDVQREISGLAYDSRKVVPGGVFVCIKGTHQDGHSFIPQVLKQGAAAVVVEGEAGLGLLPPEVTGIAVEDGRAALAQLGAAFYGYPAERLKIIGVTGTNGKTTTTYLIRSILQEAGFKVGLLGTIHYAFGAELIPAARTTPESLDLQQMFAQMLENGARYAVMEVSSHALELKRVYGCRFAAAVFSNLTQDHLDFHGDMEHYLAAKQKLFLSLDAQAAAVINMDDAYGRRIGQGCRGRILGYGLNGADLQIKAENYKFSREGIEATVRTPAGSLQIKSRLMGEYNLYNILSAVGAAYAEGIPPEVIEAGIARQTSVPGRFETVDCGQPFIVAVDYAHTDDALTNVLKMARKLCSGRLITVFGAGGERDRTKRPLMGRAAATLSDAVLITSDNPRGDDPMQIVQDIEQGVIQAGRKRGEYAVVLDRYMAIREAIDLARAGDVVVIAGKGHETYQILGNKTIHFDDREVARQVLQASGFGLRL